jgi:hypothetical protein
MSIDRGQPVPIKSLKAPKGKLNFIQGLQPFFAANEVILLPTVEVHSQLTQQLINFPTGRIDIPNALAYAMKMRPGRPMFDNFQETHVVPNILQARNAPYYLAVNSIGKCTTAILVQLVNGQYRIIRDWIYEGDAGTVLQDIIKAATLETMKPIKLVCPPKHFSNYDTIGLRAAARATNHVLHKGGDLKKGLEETRRLMSITAHGAPSLVVSPHASWSLRAFVGGYARQIDKTGVLGEDAAEGPYATLIEGLQSLIAFPNVSEVDNTQVFAQTSGGHRYLTARRK